MPGIFFNVIFLMQPNAEQSTCGHTKHMCIDTCVDVHYSPQKDAGISTGAW